MNKLALTLALSTFLSGMAMADTVRVGTSADFAPWESVNAAGEIVGFDRDVIDEVCKRIAADCSVANQAFDGLLPSLQVGKFDVVISGLSITEERAAQVAFSLAYAEPPYQFAVTRDGGLAGIETRADMEKALEGKVVGVQTGSTHEAVVRANLPSATVRLYERTEQIADDLTAGRLDAGLLEESVWKSLFEGRDQLVVSGALLTSADYPQFGHGIAIAMKQDNAALKERIDGAIAAMLADGTVKGFAENWFGTDISFKAQQ